MADKDDKSGLLEGAATEFTDAMSYGDYPGLARLLTCQEPRSDRHDEILFIVIHQATELWLKLVLHEFTAAMAQIRGDDLPPAFKMLARVSRIQAQFIQSWDVLSTLTSADYMTFREVLANASGFESHQYRLIEFTLGNKNPAMLLPHEHDAENLARLTAALEAPSLYQEAILLLARRGFGINPGQTKRDWREVHEPDTSVRAAWLTVYRDTEAHWGLYELAEKLVDLEDLFQQWRFHHMTTVERVIGHKRGIGGTSDVPYLQQALKTRLFPKLWEVRTEL